MMSLCQKEYTGTSTKPWPLLTIVCFMLFRSSSSQSVRGRVDIGNYLFGFQYHLKSMTELFDQHVV
jgi:hypothetical protein